MSPDWGDMWPSRHRKLKDHQTDSTQRDLYWETLYQALKNQTEILKAVREKRIITYKGILIKQSADFSAETLWARREWDDIFNMLKKKKQQQKTKNNNQGIVNPAKLPFIGEVRLSQTNKNEGNLSPLDLPYRKC